LIPAALLGAVVGEQRWNAAREFEIRNQLVAIANKQRKGMPWNARLLEPGEMLPHI
jgi:hypothetical protein